MAVRWIFIQDVNRLVLFFSFRQRKTGQPTDSEEEKMKIPDNEFVNELLVQGTSRDFCPTKGGTPANLSLCATFVTSPPANPFDKKINGFW